MSSAAADRLRALVKEHYHGLISLESYRERRAALLDSLQGDLAKSAQTKSAADTRPRADTTQPAPKPAQPPPPAPPPPVAPAPAAAPRAASGRLVVGGAIGVAVIALALIGYRMLGSRTDAPAPAVQESAAALSAGDALLEQFMARNVWDPDAVRNLEVGWNTALTESQRQSTLASPTYARFGDTLRRRLREEEALGGAAESPEFVRLVELATELKMPYAASLARPAPPAAREAPAARAAEERPTFVGEATQAGTRTQPEAAATAPPGRLDTSPAPASSPPATPPAAAPKAAPTADAAPTAAAPAAASSDAAATECSAALLNSRRPFCNDALRGGGEGPGLVIVAAGQFSMGNDQTPNASPAHSVTIAAPFAMSVYETSFAEFERYCKSAAQRCPENPWGDPAFPVVLVDWDEAAAYAAWLSAETGQRYRLPSEAEWEYAARANTQTPYPFGNEVTPSNARSSVLGQITSPIANTDRSVNRNAFRLMNMIGNVREWVADEWHADYAGAPTDGSGRLGDAAKSHSVRGGSYADGALPLRSAARIALDSGTQDRVTGFRVVRELAR